MNPGSVLSVSLKNSSSKTRRQGRRGPAWGKIAAIVLVLAALAVAWRYTPLADYLTLSRVNGWARAIRGTPWAPVVLVLAYTPASWLMFPRPLITLTAVIAFGAWLGLAFALLGITVASLVCYYVGRLASGKTMRRLAGDYIDSIGKVLRRNAFTSILALSFVPAPPFVVQGAIAGALRLSVWKYALATLLGNAPGMVATTFFGRQIAAALQEESISYWILAAVIVAFIAMTFVVRRWFARQIEQDSKPTGKS